MARQAEAAARAAAAEPGATVKTNVYGDKVVVRPHISPRTKRLTKQHLNQEEFPGNYGQRLYQYGVSDFHKVRTAASCRPPLRQACAERCFGFLTQRFSRFALQKRDEKVGILKGTVDLSAMSETRPHFQTVKTDGGSQLRPFLLAANLEHFIYDLATLSYLSESDLLSASEAELEALLSDLQPKMKPVESRRLRDAVLFAKNAKKVAGAHISSGSGEEKVLVGTFLPNLELTKTYKSSKPKNPDDAAEKPFWERLHVED